MAQGLDTLIVSSNTRLQLTQLIKHPTQGLLLTGKGGVGLRTIAETMAYDITGSKSGEFLISSGGESSISIEKVRSLYKLFKTKHEATVIIIDDAEEMKTDAQNALLKLLEEPPKNTYFILTSHEPERLLPTIHSRLQQVVIPSSSETETSNLTSHLDPTLRAQIQFLASGYPAEVIRLSQDDSYFETQKNLMVRARDCMASDQYAKTIQLTRISDRDEAVAFLNMLSKICLFTLDNKSQSKTIDNISAIEKALNRLSINANVRLTLSQLALELQ